MPFKIKLLILNVYLKSLDEWRNEFVNNTKEITFDMGRMK